MTNKTGGSAFPVTSDNYSNPDSTGMTLRDYFAARAMAIMWDAYAPNIKIVTESAYQMADEMIKARSNT